MKRRELRGSFFSSSKHILGKEFDLVIVDANGRVVVVDAKAGTGQFPANALLRLHGDYGHGKSQLLTEGSAEQAMFRFFLDDSELPNAESKLQPLKVDPPRLADFFISFVPLKHREPLPGDLEEEWNRLIRRHSFRTATFLYWVQVIYTFAGFWSRPLLGIVGIGWMRKLVELLMNRLMK